MVCLGAVATYYTTRAFLALSVVEIPTNYGVLRIEPQLSIPALLFAATALLIAVLVFGLEPALNLTRQTLTGSLASEAGVAPPSRARRQRSLIRWQVALSACFFTITVVLAKVVVTEARHDPGIALDRLVVATMHFGVQGWDETRARRAIDRALDFARTRGEIASVSVSTGLPFGFQMTSGAEVTTPDRPFVPGGRSQVGILLSGSPNLLRTLEVPLLRGQAFDDRDAQREAGRDRQRVDREAPLRQRERARSPDPSQR